MTTKKKSISTGSSTPTCKTRYAGKRGVTRIHVNQHNIRDNQKKGTALPVITVKKGKQNVYGHEVEVDGPSVVVYSPDKPLNCGARVWIETVSTVRVTERDSDGGVAKVIELEGKMTDVNQELSALEDSLDSGASTEALQQAAQQAQEAAEVIVEEGAETGLFEVPDQETPAQMTKRWVKYGRKHLKGRTIKNVRYMEPNESDGLMWHSRSIVLELDNGTLLYPSSDDEGNNAGTLFGNAKDKDGNPEDLTFPVLWR